MIRLSKKIQIYILALGFLVLPVSLAFGEDSLPPIQGLEEIKKQVDPESLGLDNLEEKAVDVPKIKKNIGEVKEHKDIKQITDNISNEIVKTPPQKPNNIQFKDIHIKAFNKYKLANPQEYKVVASKADDNSKEKVEEKAESEVVSKEEVVEKSAPTPTLEIIEEPIKNITNQEEEQISEAEREAIRKENKINKLRDKYLIKYSVIDGKIKDHVRTIDPDKIIPTRKDINRFQLTELPPPPILSNIRIGDNKHIPFILTKEVLTDVIFEAVSEGDVAFFNSVYDKINEPNLRNRFGDTILSYAILLQKYEIISSILAKGANPNLVNGLGYTPIEIIIELRDFKSLEMLVNNNADLFYTDFFGRNYLMHSARAGFLPAVEVFLQKGLDINQVDKDGFSALTIAYRNKRELIVKYLLKYGAKPWIERDFNPRKHSIIRELENRWR